MRSLAHPDFVKPVVYEVTALPEDSSDNQIAATISVMKRLAKEDSRSAAEQRLASELLSQCSTPDEYVNAVFSEAKRRMYFQRDEVTAGPFGGAVELLIRPSYVIDVTDATGQQVPGDCDCFSMLVASLLLAGGVDCAFTTISSMASEPNEFTHVYVTAWPKTSHAIAVDASHGKHVGWEAPNFGRHQNWELNAGVGNCTELVLMALIFVAGLMFNWGDSGSGSRGYMETA